ncbi:MAG: hypothetical protein U0838_07115 [Chloroflexota bacterium]
MDCFAKRVDPSSVSITGVVRNVARKPEMDGRVHDQRLHDKEHVRGARAGHGGRHGDPLLVLHLQLGAEGERSALAWPRCSVVAGIAYQTVMPAPMRAGVDLEHRADDLVVAEGRAGAADWASEPTERPQYWQVRPDLATHLRGHLRLTARMITSAPEIASTWTTVRMPCVVARAARRSARMARDDLARLDELALGNPKIIASANAGPTVRSSCSSGGHRAGGHHRKSGDQPAVAASAETAPSMSG